MARLLIIDDDVELCHALRRIFAETGHDVHLSHSLEDGLEKASKMGADVVFLDVRMNKENGLEYLPHLKKVVSRPEVVVMTGHGDADSAERAIQGEAWDYIQKGAGLDSLVQVLGNVLEYRRRKPPSDLPEDVRRQGIVGGSPAIESCLALAARAARTETNVLIQGETGTGKEMFARFIHENSPRADKNFVVVDCGSLPKTLAESLLFGHAKGAYTGAHRSETGLIRHAHGGTLFLDEVGELPLGLQKAFLRVLEERRFRPIGDVEEVESDFRLVSATNKDLSRMVDEGRFREDLLFRLRAVTIHLPALRDRVDDIKLLAEAHVERLSRAARLEAKTLSPMFIKTLEAYSWPGNIRELNHALESVFAEARDEPIFFDRHLPAAIRVAAARSAFARLKPEDRPEPCPGRSLRVVHPVRDKEPEGGPGAEEPLKWQDFRRIAVENAERSYLADILARSGGEVKKASALSGLSIPRLYELLRKYRLTARTGSE